MGFLDNSSALTCGNGMVKVQELGFSLDQDLSTLAGET
jgi:hypothetical protein